MGKKPSVMMNCQANPTGSDFFLPTFLLCHTSVLTVPYRPDVNSDPDLDQPDTGARSRTFCRLNDADDDVVID
jgi:hypothetical protein